MSIREGTRTVYDDTSIFYSTLDLRDRISTMAGNLLRQIQEWRIGVVTTWEVVVKTVTLPRYRHVYLGAHASVQRILPTLNLVYLDETELRKALMLFGPVRRGQWVSLYDAISAVVLKDRVRSIPCLAFDDVLSFATFPTYVLAIDAQEGEPIR